MEAALGAVKIYYYYDPLNDSYVFTNMCANYNECKPLLVEKGTVLHQKGFKINPGAENGFDNLIAKAAEQYKLDFFLIKSIIKAESCFDIKATSSKGAMGLMQLMPDTAKLLGVSDGYSPEDNVMGGSKFLKNLISKFKDTEKAIAAYNAGPAAVVYYEGIPPYKETQEYVRKVKNFYFEYTKKQL